MYLNNNLYGVILIIAASLLHVIINNILKHILSCEIPPLLLIFYKSGLCVLIMLPLMRKRMGEVKRLFFNKKFVLLNILRGGAGFLGSLFWILAIETLSISECVAISFTTPLFITLLASLFLNERITNMHWLLLFIGFIGAMMIIRPISTDFNIYSIYPIIAAFLWATSALIVRVISFKYSVVSAIFLPKSISFIISAMIIASFTSVKAQYTALNVVDAMYMILFVSITALLIELLMALSYKKAPMSIVIPFDFTRLIFSSIIDYTFYNQLIGIWTVVGAISIILSSILIYKSTPNKRFA